MANRQRPGGVANNGYWGIALKKGETYELSLLARGGDGFTGPLTSRWKAPTASSMRARRWFPQQRVEELQAHSQAQRHRSPGPPRHQHHQPGTFWLDMVSLFPKRTWKGRPNGLRPDLAEMLAGLKPAFVRFPGGCWVEGDTMSLAYRWKQTMGDLSERRSQYNIWKYHVTHGLGYHEYLQMCEDLGRRAAVRHQLRHVAQGERAAG